MLPEVLKRSREADAVALLVAGTLAGALVASLARFGPAPQAAAVLAIGIGPPAVLLFLARPHVALSAYLFLLPLLVSVPLVAGMNGGEIVSLAVMLLGTFTLWGARKPIVPSLVRLRPVLIPLALLVLVSLVSLLVNRIFRPQEVASAVLKYATFGVIPLLAHVHLREKRHAKLALVGLLLGGAAVALYTMVAYVAGWTYSAEYDWNRPMGTFGNWNQLGGFMALVSLPTLGFAVTRHGTKRILFALLFALEITVLLLSLTLGSILGVIAGSLLLLLLLRPRWSRVLPVLMLAVLATGIAFTASPLLQEKVTRFDERLTDRLRTYATGAMMFRDKFWWGFGSEQNMASEILLGEADYGLTRFGVSTVVPHNAFLKVSAEKGVFGLLAFTALVVGALRVLLRVRWRFRQAPQAGVYYGVVAGMFAFLVQNMTNDLLQHARLGILFFSLLVIVDRLAPEREPA